MKNMCVLFLIFFSLNSFAAVCLDKMTAMNLKENAWLIEHNNADVETTILDKKGVLETIEQNNTGLGQDDIDNILAFVDEPAVEYYSFFVNVSTGSAADLLMVNTEDCSVLGRYSTYLE